MLCSPPVNSVTPVATLKETNAIVAKPQSFNGYHRLLPAWLFLAGFFLLTLACSQNYHYGNTPKPQENRPGATHGQNPVAGGALTKGEWRDIQADQPVYGAAYSRAGTSSEHSGETSAKHGSSAQLYHKSNGSLVGTAHEPTPTHAPQSILDETLALCDLSQQYWQKGELESALEALDQAYSLILSLDDDDLHTGLTQQKEDLRFLISKRILEIYASRHIVVNGQYDEIPLTLNSHVEAEIRRFTTGAEKGFFKRSYQRSGLYREFIVEELKKEGLPEALSWLPLIESGYKTNALSRARALGLWQFISSTGYKFGLARNTYVDERLDPVKSTHAAIAYLKELHQMFGDWTTVLAGYNCGENRVLRTIRSQNINYLDNFWDLYERLPRETARYVPRFLATLHIVSNPAKYGLDKLVLDKPLNWETITVARQMHLKNIAKNVGASLDDLRALNPELRHSITPNTSYKLRIPVGTRDTLLATLNTIPASHIPKTKRSHYVYHRVRRGENLSTIAQRYGVSMKAIARANRLNKNYTIVTGRSLKIPTSRASAAKGETTPLTAWSKTTTHRVRKGDSLWILARRYGTTTSAIQRENKLRGSKLYIGQKLKMPAPGKSAAKSSKGQRSYTVKRGDTPFKIATRNDMSLNQFLKINRLSRKSKIYPGQRLYVY
jgi:membrane-bound lytic murein transglycosylase D